jgi:hypothetical protein
MSIRFPPHYLRTAGAEGLAKSPKNLIAPLVELISLRISRPCMLLDVDSTGIGANDPHVFLERAEAAESSRIKYARTEIGGE